MILILVLVLILILILIVCTPLNRFSKATISVIDKAAIISERVMGSIELSVDKFVGRSVEVGTNDMLSCIRGITCLIFTTINQPTNQSINQSITYTHIFINKQPTKQIHSHTLIHTCMPHVCAVDVLSTRSQEEYLLEGKYEECYIAFKAQWYVVVDG